jgi:hypothetical protein
MDAALVARAAELGADVVEGFEARALGFSDGRATEVRGHARGGAAETVFPASAILAADGRDSALARLVDPGRRRRRSGPRFGIKAHYRGVEGLRGAVELHWFRGGYVGLTDLGEGRANVCSLIDRAVAGDIPREPGRLVGLFFTNPCARARVRRARSGMPSAGSSSAHSWRARASSSGRRRRHDRSLRFRDVDGFRSAEIAVEEILRDPPRRSLRGAGARVLPANRLSRGPTLRDPPGSRARGRGPGPTSRRLMARAAGASAEDL